VVSVLRSHGRGHWFDPSIAHGEKPLVDGGFRSFRVPSIGPWKSVATTRRRLGRTEKESLESALRKAWADLRRLRREVDDIDSFDEDSNAWLPVQAYYAVYKAILAFAVASRQAAPRDHRKALSLVSRAVERGLLPYPWALYCSGCPQTGSHQFGGGLTPQPLHPLANPDPASTSDRIAMFLRTTRQKELDRRFADERRRRVAPGRSRRNISRTEKERMAGNLAPTTLFDLFWRLRMKANYEDADTFVLGAAGIPDARAFADSLAILADASVAALEALVIAYVGPDDYSRFVTSYRDRVRANPDSPVAVRAAMFQSGSVRVDEAPF